MEMEKCRKRLQRKSRGRLPSPTVPVLVSSVSCLQTSPRKPGPEISWSQGTPGSRSASSSGAYVATASAQSAGTPPPQRPCYPPPAGTCPCLGTPCFRPSLFPVREHGAWAGLTRRRRRLALPSPVPAPVETKENPSPLPERKRGGAGGFSVAFLGGIN